MRILFYLSCALVGLQMGACIYKVAHAKTITLSKSNLIHFDDNFNAESTSKASYAALFKNFSTKSNKNLYLVLDTPGGSIDAGIEMIYNLNAIRRKVHTITIYAASMGFQTVQGVNGKRYILKDGIMMSHKARGGFEGEFPGQLDKRYNFYKNRLQNLDIQCVKRTNGKQTLKSYQDLYENEYWCQGQKCVDDGFSDQIVNVKCDKTLSGLKEKLAQSMQFMGAKIDIFIVKAECPLITGPLDFKILINGQSMENVLRKIKNLSIRSEIRKKVDLKIKQIKNRNKNVTR